MKNSNKKILIFEFILFVIFVLNCFMNNILNKNSIIFLILGSIFVFKKIIGIEKDNKRYTKDILVDLLIVFLMTFIFYYLLGIFIGFYRNENYLTLYGIKEIILPLVLLIITKEYLRYIILRKCEGSKLLCITTCILFILLDLTNVFDTSMLFNKVKLFDFIALCFFPSICNNIVANYIAISSNYKINLFWMLIIYTYIYVLPIIPNSGNYVLSIIKIIFPLIILSRVKIIYDKDNDEFIGREYQKKHIVPLVFAGLFVTTMVYFTSGLFKYQVIAIASDSMEPYMSRGDIVVIKKVTDDLNKLKKGQVIAYRYDGVIVVHRIEKIIELDEKRFYYSKGDSNKDIDNYVVYEENIIGVVNQKIPLLGLPTIWISEI